MGKGEGEEINTGEGRGSQGQSHALFAKMDRGLECLCRGLPHIDPASLGQAEGEWQHCREGDRSRSF